MRRSSILAAATATLTTLAPAQLAGSYTINPAGTGSRNFKTFDEAIKSLFVAGVGGPVDILVSPGTYNESVLVPPIAGLSATNTVRLRGIPALPVILKGTISSTFSFVGLSGYANGHFVLEGMTFDSAPGFAVFATLAVANVEIVGCTFGPNHRPTASSEFRDALIVKDNTTTGEAGWKIHHCKMTFPSKAGTRTNYGIYMQNCGSWEIHHNDINLNGATKGLYMINNNRELDRVYDNLIYGDLATTTSTTANTACVIHADLSNYNNEFTHNTIVVNVPGLSGCIFSTGGLTGTNGDNKIWGNVLAMTGPGTAIVHFPSLISTMPPLQSNGNLFWLPNGDVGRIGDGRTGTTVYKTLALWQAAPTPTPQDAASLEQDPLLFSTVAPFNLKPLPISPVKDAAVATPSYVTTDYQGRVRDGKPDIGAFELNGFGVFGAGCPGTGMQVPAIGSSGVAALGSTNFAVALGNARAGAPVALAAGFSTSAFGPVALPYDLRGGCALLVSPDLTVTGASSAAGTATQPWPIANNSAYLGLSLYLQWVVVDSGSSSSLGICMSNGGSLNL